MARIDKIKKNDRTNGKKFLFGGDDFIPSSELNKKLFGQWEKYEDIKNTTTAPDFSVLFDTIAKKLPEQEINPSSGFIGKSKKVSFFGSRWMYAAAAVFAGLLLIGGVLWKSNIVQHSLGISCEVVTYNGEKKEVLLPDGSRVWLNADSKIVYDKKFRKDFRKVKLIGEAFFDVVKNPEWPFFVETSQITIKVLGTKFNVKAYKEDKTIETTLESGLISLQQSGRFFEDTQSVLVKPQQKATFSLKEHRVLVQNVDSKSVTSWKEGRLVFDNEEILEVIKKLQRWYGVKIKMLNDTRNDHITLTITNERLAEAIKLLQYTTASGFMVEKIATKEKQIYKYEPGRVENK